MTGGIIGMDSLGLMTAPGFPVEIVILDDSFFARVSVPSLDAPLENAADNPPPSRNIPAQ